MDQTDNPTTRANRARAEKEDFGWVEPFLEALERTGNVSAAARSAGVNRQYTYEVRGEKPEFAARWDAALEVAADGLEEEARRRGVEGWDEPVFWQGEEVGVKRKYSNTLLLSLLKAHRPEKYRERYDVTTDQRQKVEIDLSNATLEQLRALAGRDQT